MKIQKAERKHAKIKILLQGCSGSGKTFSSLLLAYGLTDDWNKVCILDSENNSSHLYSRLGGYSVLSLGNYAPETYIEAIEMVEDTGEFEVLIIDSISHEWEYILEEHSKMAGNSFTNWNKLTPRHNKFLKKMLHTNLHIISTARTKQDYVLVEKNGKRIPEKVGLKSIQRDGVDYEFTLVFDLDIKHFIKVSKDRTGIFDELPGIRITKKVGERIREWCETGTSLEEVRQQIKECSDIEILREIYKKYPSFKDRLKDLFMLRSKELKETNSITLKHSENGVTNK